MSMGRGMNKQAVVDMHNGILVIKKNSFESVLFFHLFLLVGGQLLYNIVVVFAIH